MGAKDLRAGEPGQSLTAPDGLRMTLVATPATNRGKRLEMEWSVPPGRRLVAADHYHPDGPEVWRVLEEPVPELTGGVQGYFETFFAFAQRGRVDEQGEIGSRLQNLLTIHDLLMPGTFLAGPPRTAQRIVLGILAAFARAAGRRPYAQPEFDVSR